MNRWTEDQTPEQIVADIPHLVRVAVDQDRPRKDPTMKTPIHYVYLAGPLYGSGTVGENIRRMVHLSDAVRETGFTPFLPHLYFHQDLISPHDRGYWLALDCAWVMRCDCLIRLAGESPGSNVEVELMHSMERPVLDLSWDAALAWPGLLSKFHGQVVHKERIPGWTQDDGDRTFGRNGWDREWHGKGQPTLADQHTLKALRMAMADKLKDGSDPAL